MTLGSGDCRPVGVVIASSMTSTGSTRIGRGQITGGLTFSGSAEGSNWHDLAEEDWRSRLRLPCPVRNDVITGAVSRQRSRADRC